MNTTITSRGIDLPSHEQPEAVLRGKKCPYCGLRTEYIDSVEIYGRSYGMMYRCKPCQAWVGVHHKVSRKALGRVANKRLRDLKQKAHASFDPLWMMKKGSRSNAYSWLAEQMGIPVEFCHIGMFNPAQCEQVVDICMRFVSSVTSSRHE